MLIKNEQPPNILTLQRRFSLEKGIVFTFGEILYNPDKMDIPVDILVHEGIHARQQTDPERWWKRYCEDNGFLILQESEAYHAQYEYLKTRIKDRNKQALVLHQLALIFSGPIYKNIIPFSEALRKIKHGL